MAETRKRVVILGGGFGGVECAKALRDAPVDVVVIDRQNHHLFQPLLYQVATAGLASTNIAWPIRAILNGEKRCRVLMAQVEDVDMRSREVIHTLGRTPFDILVLATGMTHSWFGHDEWAEHALGLKTLDEAQRIRSRVLGSFEEAEAVSDEEERARLLTIVVIGGGPTGVEMAGSLAELAHRALARDFRNIDPTKAQIVLIEAEPRLLSGYPEDLSAVAQKSLEQMGVRVMTGTRVQGLDAHGVTTHDATIPSKTVVWAAGVRATPVATWAGVEPAKGGRIEVDDWCRVPGLEGVFAIGDVTSMKQDGKYLPGVAQVAMQQGTFVGKVIRAQLEDKPLPKPFRYKDRGSMATIGRSSAVAVVWGRHFSGFIAWVMWLFVHLVFLFSFRNRVQVFMQWVAAYVNYSRGARVILRPENMPTDVGVGPSNRPEHASRA